MNSYKDAAAKPAAPSPALLNQAQEAIRGILQNTNPLTQALAPYLKQVELVDKELERAHATFRQLVISSERQSLLTVHQQHLEIVQTAYLDAVKIYNRELEHLMKIAEEKAQCQTEKTAT